MKYLYEKDLNALLIKDKELVECLLRIRKNMRYSDLTGKLVYRAILDSSKKQKMVAFKLCPGNDETKREMAEEVFEYFDAVVLRIAK